MSASPSVTVMIPTYCRTRRLAEAVFSALNQQYDGEIEVLVLNDYHRQELVCNDPRVHIVNLRTKIHTLAEKRHAMLHMADKEWVAFLDDDDLLMPWHLSQLDPKSIAAMPKNYFVVDDVDGWSLDVVPGGLSFMLQRLAAVHVGFVSGLDVGEDNAFRNAIIDRYAPLIATPPRPSYVWRRFLRGVGHISHMVKADASPDVARFMAAADERILLKLEPAGRVEISPRWERDYWKEAITRFPGEV